MTTQTAEKQTTKTPEELRKVFDEYRVGAGAFEYAVQYVEGLSREEAAPVIAALLRGELHDPSENRVKRCAYCGSYWHDDSLRNTKRTCCEDCKRGIKTLQKQQQRADEELLNPKPRKRTLMDDYVYWLEYPYWSNEYSMRKICGLKYETPHGLAVMDAIEAKNTIYGEGNHRKVTTNYDF